MFHGGVVTVGDKADHVAPGDFQRLFPVCAHAAGEDFVGGFHNGTAGGKAGGPVEAQRERGVDFNAGGGEFAVAHAGVDVAHVEVTAVSLRPDMYGAAWTDGVVVHIAAVVPRSRVFGDRRQLDDADHGADGDHEVRGEVQEAVFDRSDGTQAASKRSAVVVIAVGTHLNIDNFNGNPVAGFDAVDQKRTSLA